MSPNGDGEESFYVSKRMLAKLEKRGPTWKYEDAAFIDEVLPSPAAVFEGLKREGFEDCLCYSGVPERDWSGPEPDHVPRVGMVFVIYIASRMIIDWDWRKEDDERAGHPEDWQQDFTRRLWPKS
jgi:hypothetical protein